LFQQSSKPLCLHAPEPTPTRAAQQLLI
jgi:hypothetical protein